MTCGHSTRRFSVPDGQPAPRRWCCLWWPLCSGLQWPPSFRGRVPPDGAGRCRSQMPLCQALRCRLSAACLMFAVASLAALAQTRVWRSFSIKPSAVSLWVASSCQCRGLGTAHMMASLKQLGLPRHPSFGCLQYSAQQGTASLLRSGWPPRSPSCVFTEQPAPSLDYIAEHLI